MWESEWQRAKDVASIVVGVDMSLGEHERG